MDQFGGSWITESQIRNTDRFGGPLIPKSQLKIRIDFAVHGSLNPNLVIREILFFFRNRDSQFSKSILQP